MPNAEADAAAKKAIEAFIARVTRLEQRYRRDKYADAWLMPRELLIAIRDVLKDRTEYDEISKSV